MSLRVYHTKRDFNHTREPAGKPTSAGRGTLPLFVVQKHAASHLHYDFRLEIGGVLKSWAVPKGFPFRRGERRLAVQVEDHPMEYRRFEGTIPKGNYGAGTVMVWDVGTYELSGGAPATMLDSGKLHLQLRGKKLNGEWTLVRLRRTNDASKAQWLLLKSGNDAQPVSARAENRSALSNRSMEQITAANGKVWRSNRTENQRQEPRKRSRHGRGLRSASRRKAPTSTRAVQYVDKVATVQLSHLPKSKPRFIEPMKALLVQELPRGNQWEYEIKFDGVRALTIQNGHRVRLISRAGKDLGGKYPTVLGAVNKLETKGAVLDGEVVAVDARGRPSFQLLQSFQTAGSGKPTLLYYVFDILNLDGRDLTGLPLWQRKGIAQSIVAGLGPVVHFSAGIHAESARLVREMKKRGLEGIIGKERDSKYEPGRRSGAWLKLKWTHEQEFVIGGFTEPKGSRHHFGAILVGYYEGTKLRFAGKVGTGFDQRSLADLHHEFQRMVQTKCPFTGLPEVAGLTAAQMRFCTWMKPRLVCQVRFSEWTRDDHLRQPAFLGLREDKSAREVVRETAR